MSHLQIASLTKQRFQLTQLLLQPLLRTFLIIMSLPFAFNARRFLRQSPATFLRQCRTNTGKTFAVCAFATASPQTTHPTIPRDRNTRYPGRPLLPHSPALLRPDGRARPFSKSAPSHATTVLQNPRVGDDGNEMTIEISDRAAKV